MKRIFVTSFFILIPFYLLAQERMESALNRVKEYVAEGNYEQALFAVEEVLGKEPENFHAKYLKAKVHRLQGAPAAATDILDKLIIMLPISSELFYERGLARLDSKDFELAINDFTNAIKIDPSFSGFHFERGCAFYSLEKYQEAEEDLSTAIKLAPKFPDAYNIRGYNRIGLKEDKKAIGDFTKALSLDPEYYDCYYGRGLAYYYLYQDEKACKDFKVAFENGLDYAQEYVEGCR